MVYYWFIMAYYWFIIGLRTCCWGTGKLYKQVTAAYLNIISQCISEQVESHFETNMPRVVEKCWGYQLISVSPLVSGVLGETMTVAVC